MSTTPTLNGQVVGLAHYATRAVLEGELAPTGTSFPQALALNAVANAGGMLDRSRLVDRMTGTLKIDAAAVLATIAELAEAGLVRVLPADEPRVDLTEAGRARQRRIAEISAGIAGRVYADIPAADLAVTARVLTLVTERANAELAAARG
ncbi:hypothetical protein ABT214_22310 [Micromonospora purpureochromogenes]|uniref:hypothetical protein n=1 Tax=Micromonospora purpureochromogenes TaxID=47872 RepID=UPI003324926C